MAISLAYFEYDGQTGYFYLYEVGGNECKKVVGAIRIVAESADFEEADVCVRWNASEDAVGLYIRGDLWALFDTIRHQKHGGDYRPGDRPSLPTTLSGDSTHHECAVSPLR
ncbi:MAG: DUF2251 domain-containing protein [Polyangiaceae bacterium]|nr:DUF2251 domain-containing protein [Polyangiaceae bacterium]